MVSFINGVTDIISSSFKVKPKNYKYNYFNCYVNGFSMEKEKKDSIISILENNHKLFDNKTIREIVNFLSDDISNEKVKPTTENIKSYILFCLYTYIIDLKVENIYVNENSKLILFEKNRPHSYVGKIFNYKDQFLCDVYGLYIDDMKFSENRKTIFNKLKKNKCVMPYYDIFDNIIIYEKLNNLDPTCDPLIVVLKDLVNQLKSINKYYWFEYFDKNSIGRSNIDLKRYFICFFDSLIHKKESLNTHNIYDGRKNYTKIGPKDQIRTVINILSEIYVTGYNSYIEKTKLEPFKTYLEMLEKFDTSTVYDDFILYLMDVN